MFFPLKDNQLGFFQDNKFKFKGFPKMVEVFSFHLIVIGVDVEMFLRLRGFFKLASRNPNCAQILGRFLKDYAVLPAGTRACLNPTKILSHL